MPRSLDELRRDQDVILSAYRAERTTQISADSRPSSPSMTIGFAYGRVAEVVGSDEQLGPHLRVMQQSWTGAPPAPVDVGLAPVVAYPLPGRAVSDFAADQLVRIEFIPGVVLASAC